MKITSEHTELILGALCAVTSIAATQANVESGRNTLRAMDNRLTHDRDMFGMQTEMIRIFLHALVERRLDVVQDGFLATLSLYADQNRHFMSQQTQLTKAQIKATDPLERANLTTRLNEIDIQLKRICRDAANLNREMNRVVLLIGGTMPVIPMNDQKALRFN